MKPTTSSNAIAPLAVINLGLRTMRAKLPRELKAKEGCTGEINAIAGPETQLHSGG